MSDEEMIEQAALVRASIAYQIPNTPDNREFLLGTSAFFWARLDLTIRAFGGEMLRSIRRTRLGRYLR